MKQGTPYKQYIDGAILYLLESGKIHKSRTKWWKQKRGGGNYKKIMNFQFWHGVFITICNDVFVNTRVTFSLKHFLKGKCAAMGGGSGGGALGMPNVVGVFIVTLGGCLVAT